MSDLLLYNYYRSSTSYRVRIALHLKRLSFEYRAVSLLKDGGEQHKPEYRELNPAGEVPTLVHGEKVIAQSMAIIEYLDEVFPASPLFPKDSYARAKARQICEGINCGHALQNLKVQNYLTEQMIVDAEKKSQWLNHWISNISQSTEKLLTSTAGRYAFGDTPGAVDAFIVPHVFSAQRFNIDLQKYPTLLRVNGECMKLETFQKAHPSHQVDTPKN